MQLKSMIRTAQCTVSTAMILKKIGTTYCNVNMKLVHPGAQIYCRLYRPAVAHYTQIRFCWQSSLKVSTPGSTSIQALPLVQHIQPPTGDWCVSKLPWDGDSCVTADGPPSGQDSKTNTFSATLIPFLRNSEVNCGPLHISKSFGPASVPYGTPTTVQSMALTPPHEPKHAETRLTENSERYTYYVLTCVIVAGTYSIPQSKHISKHNQPGHFKIGLKP